MTSPVDSPTKAKFIARFANNALLQAPIVAAVQRSPFDLSVDQPTMPPSPTIQASSLAALERGETHYVDTLGIAPLREQLAQYLQQMGIAESLPSRVLATAGFQECRFLTLQKLGELLGPVGLPSIVHPGARQALGVRERAIVEFAVEPTGDRLPTPAAIEAALQSGAKLLYLESPSRLTGAVYDAASVAAIAALLQSYDASAIWDQGLSPWVENYHSLAAVPGIADRVVAIGEAWPGQGLEGWPISYISGKAEWLEPMRSLKQIMSICTNTASQYAALAASYQYDTLHPEQLQKLTTTRQSALAQAKQLGVESIPGGAVNLVTLLDNGTVASKLKAAGYDYADGAAFGAPGTLRLAVTLDGALIQSLA